MGSIIDEYSIQLRLLINLIKDGHTRTTLHNSLNERFENGNHRISGQIIQDTKHPNKYFCYSRFSGNKTRREEILAINGVSVSEIAEYKNLIAVEEDSIKNLIFNRNFSFYSFLRTQQTDSALITTVFKEDTITSAIILRDNSNCCKKHEDHYNLMTIGSSYAILDIFSFSASRISPKEFELTLLEIADSLETLGTKSLSISLSLNGGGSEENAMLLASYLGMTSYQSKEFIELKTSKQLKSFVKKKYLKPYMYPLLPFSFLSKNARSIFYKRKGGITRFNENETLLKPFEKTFNGNVMLLVSHQTYSAAADFAVAFRKANRGEVSGTTGQPDEGFIDSIYDYLPYSRLKFYVSFKRYKMVE